MSAASDYSSRAQIAIAAIAGRPSSRQRLGEAFWTLLAGLFTVIALVPLLLVIGYVLYRGFERLDFEVFVSLPPTPLGEGGGFANALIGTVVMVGIGAGISVPFGILAAIYLVEFSPDRIARWIRFATNVLSGVPSILIGVALGWFFSSPTRFRSLFTIMLPLGSGRSVLRQTWMS
ncbi:MAG: hypothetical protein F6J95_017700 [Leptolyngbya sp. SIO1E4]|nr:hypothetical protein [Leptolyngbya sp. SIO1E4]